MSTGTEAPVDPRKLLAQAIAAGATDAHSRFFLAQQLAEFSDAKASIFADSAIFNPTDIANVLDAFEGTDFDPGLDISNYGIAIINLWMGSLGPKVPELLSRLPVGAKPYLLENQASICALPLLARLEFLKLLVKNADLVWRDDVKKDLAQDLFRKAAENDNGAEAGVQVWEPRAVQIEEVVASSGTAAAHLRICLSGEWDNPIFSAQDLAENFECFDQEGQSYVSGIFSEDLSAVETRKVLLKLTALRNAYKTLRELHPESPLLTSSHAQIVCFDGLELSTSQVEVLAGQSGSSVLTMFSGTANMDPLARGELLGEWLNQNAVFQGTSITKFAELYDVMWKADPDHKFFDSLRAAVVEDKAAGR